MNDLILDGLKDASTDHSDEKFEQVMQRLYEVAGKKGIDQMGRFLRQMSSTQEAQRYIVTDKGVDQMTGHKKAAFEISAPTESLVNEVGQAIDKIMAGKSWIELVFGDCFIVAIRKRKPEVSPFVCKMDCKHYIYHAISVPWSDCQYSKDLNKEPLTKENPLELMLYGDISISPIVDKIYFPTHLPLPFLFSVTNTIALLAGEIGVFVYFDHDHFFKMCQEAGLSPRWISEKEYQKSFSAEGTTRPAPPLFPSGYLLYGKDGVQVVFQHGLLFRIIFELQTCSSLIAQMHETIEKLREMGEKPTP